MQLGSFSPAKPQSGSNGGKLFGCRKPLKMSQ